MSDENELLPEDLDSLVNDLQQGKSVLLPDSQRSESDFVGKLIRTARSNHIDADYAMRLGHYVGRSHHGPTSIPKGIAPLALQPAWFTWRSVALALSSVTLVAVLSISSLLNSHVSPVSLTPPISENTFGSSSTPLKTIALQQAANIPIQAQLQTPLSITKLRAVQAPNPPHTPLPLLKTQDPTLNLH